MSLFGNFGEKNKKMIIIKLKGGLGNQMFQYALGRNLSLIHNIPLKVDSSYLKNPNQSNRSLRIDNFNTILEEASSVEINSIVSPLQNILDIVRSKKRTVVEKSNTFNMNILSRNKGYFIGHWNSEKYFKNNESIIREDFKLKNPFGEKAEIISKKIESATNSTGIHIRRGDYVSIKKIADVHGLIPILYYENAMEKIAQKFPDAEFFIFSDDIKWAEENFPKKYPVTFVSNPSILDYEELLLMSQCKHNIIANSTFSWWAAWLNINSNKTVIAPKKWFNDPSIDTTDLIPETWIKIL